MCEKEKKKKKKGEYASTSILLMSICAYPYVKETPGFRFVKENHTVNY